jgi:hypothetical protein
MSLSTDYSTSKNQANLPSLDSDHIDLSHLNLDARVVLAFWFDKNNEQYWFEENDEFDQQIKERFGKIWQAAKQGEYVTWRIAEAPTDCIDILPPLSPSSSVGF